MPKNPHADFSPVLDGYSGIGAFRFWCQTALPITYDDSLSYYELLCKVVNYLNHAIEDLSNVEENTSKLAEAYTKLQNYVNEYFDNLDIEAELKNILDTMAQDGTLDALLDPLVTNHLPGVVDDKIDDVVANQIDDAVAGQIDNTVAQQLPSVVAADAPAVVTNWLTANVNPVGSAVVVDESLTIEGAAADAKATGSAISGLKKPIKDLIVEHGDGIIKTMYGKNMFNKDNVVTGEKLSGKTGEISPTSYPAWFTSDYIRITPGETYTLRQANTAILCFYDSYKAYLNQHLAPTANMYTFTAPTDAYYLRFCMLNTMLNTEQLEVGSSISEYKNYELLISEETHLNLTEPVLEIVTNAGIQPINYSVYKFAYLKNGNCICNDKASGTTAKYIGVDLEQDVISAEIKFGFTGTSGDATIMLITSKLGCYRTAHITKGSCHWAVTRHHVLIEYFDNASQTIITHEHVFANPLDFNTEYSFKWAITHPGGANRVYIAYPDGETELINDAEFWTYNGQYLIFELFYTNTSACRPYYTGWWAHGDGGGTSADEFAGDNFLRHEFSDYENTGALTTAPTGQVYHLFSNEIWGGTPI